MAKEQTLFKNQCQLITKDGRHDYVTLEGEVINVPSVTSLVGRFYPFDYDKDDAEAVLRVQKGIERGNHVHKAMELYLKYGMKIDCFDSCGILSHKKLIFNARDKWDVLANRLSITSQISEISLYNDLFCGTIDAIGFDKNDNIYLIDFKTTNWKYYEQTNTTNKIIEKEALQLALYEMLIGKEIKKWFIINPQCKYIYSIDDKHKQKAYEQRDIIINDLLKK